jgi:hypothetical protein
MGLHSKGYYFYGMLLRYAKSVIRLCWILKADGWSSSLYTDKKENKIFLINKEIQGGAVAKSYMTNGLLMGKYLRISAYTGCGQ